MMNVVDHLSVVLIFTIGRFFWYSRAAIGLEPRDRLPIKWQVLPYRKRRVALPLSRCVHVHRLPDTLTPLRRPYYLLCRGG